jgi:sigma-B regulation protein RsbU (phosphoserine phosphatase)
VKGGGVVELPKGNAALGLSGQSAYEGRAVDVAAGETLVIYSDGVTEAQNEMEQFYGLERLKTLCRECGSVSPQQFGEKILAAVSAFEGNARRRDDLSLILLQRAS